MAAEKNFEKRIKKYLKDNNCWYCKNFANAYTKSGIPDILACVNGKFIAIEVKAQNGRATELQLRNQKQIQDAGGIAYILFPSQFEKFKSEINGLLQEASN